VRDMSGAPALQEEQVRGVPQPVDEAASLQDLILQQSHALCRGLSIVLEHHNCPVSVIEQMKEQVCRYLSTSLCESEWFKMAKYLLTFPIAKYLRNDTPPKPKLGGFVPTGAFRRWWKQRLCCFNSRNTHLWYSWLQCKRSANPLSEELVEQTYKDHLASLTRPDEGDDELIKEIFDNACFRSVLDKVRSDVTKAAPSFSVEGRTSLSASFESTRLTAGQHGYLCDLVGINEHDSIQSELVGMIWLPMAYKAGERMTNVLIELRAPLHGNWKWQQLEGQLHLWRSENQLQPLDCMIQAVLEPLKIRVISKGQSIPYYFTRGLQEAMHSSLRAMPCFRLIGRPLSPTDLLDIQTRLDWVKDPLLDAILAFHSVDYKAATDGLSWKFSRKILEYIMSGLEWDYQTLCRQVLGPHNLWYPKPVDGGKTKKEFRGTQSNGQLMGSILSFPILCLANLGLILRVLQPREGHNLELLKKILINGDDAVYQGTDTEWAEHARLGRQVGLEMSIGKAYRHRVFLNINSTCFHVKGCEVREIPFLNTGLLFGQSKVMNKESSRLGTAESHHEYENDLIPNLNEILRGCLPSKKCSILEYLFRTRKADILEECRAEARLKGRKFFMTRNLFIHESFGGMGVRAPKDTRSNEDRRKGCPSTGWQWSVNKVQKLLASALVNRFHCPVSFGYPLPGPELARIKQERPVWFKMNGKLEFDIELGAIPPRSRESVKHLELGFVPYVTNVRQADVTESSVVHGVSAYKPSKTVPLDENWYTSAEQIIQFHEWLNSSVLSGPVKELERDFDWYIGNGLSTLKMAIKERMPGTSPLTVSEAVAEGFDVTSRLALRCLQGALSLFQGAYGQITFDALAFLERECFNDHRQRIAEYFRVAPNRSSGWNPQPLPANHWSSS